MLSFSAPFGGTRGEGRLATAEALVAKAHQICPYSNATRGNMAVDIRILDFAA